MSNLGQVIEIDYTLIQPFIGQPRKRFNTQKMDELIASIKESEQQTAIKVRELPRPWTPHQYELIDGERRLRACTILKIPIKAWVKEVKDLKKQYLESVISNFCSAEHDAHETYEAIIRVRDENDYTIKQLSNVFGKSVSWVVQYLTLAKLKPSIRELLIDDQLKVVHAMAVAQLPEEQQQTVVDMILQKGLRALQIKNIVEAKLSQSGNRTKFFHPRKEREKFANFIDRSRKDVEVLMSQTPSYYREMFENVESFKRDLMITELKCLIEDLTALQDTVVRRTLKKTASV